MAQGRQEGLQLEGTPDCSVEHCDTPAKVKGFCSIHYFRDYHQRNRAKRVAQSTAYRLANREAVLKTKREYYLTHKDEHRLRMDRWRAKNRERGLQLSREWRQLHREYMSLKNTERRAKMQKGFGVKLHQLQALVHRQGGRCFYCSCPFGEGARARNWDHVIPLSRGGRHSIGNLVAACAGCNTSKGSSYVTEWRLRLRKLGRPDVYDVVDR